MKYLVIVESPAKKTKIQSFLNTIENHSFIVEASFGHIRYFENGLKSIDIKNNFEPKYAVTKDKVKVVKNLKDIKKKVDDIIIATDLDREGEAIGFHIAKVLNLDINTTKRICFNEITQKAVVDAYNDSRLLDMNLVNAQQTRSILDLLIGFEISPLLWSYIQPKLSAGRCQSPTLKLIKEREDAINNFKSNKSYTITGDFEIIETITTNYHKDINNKEKVLELLPEIINHDYKLKDVKIKKNNYSAPAPYITSSIQQDASTRFGLSPKFTMQILQGLYEKGLITYMRTDSTVISNDFMKSINDYLDDKHPGFFKKNTFKSKVSNAQEAHECIRPVSLNNELPDGLNENELKLYNMIKNRTISSQMKKYIEESHNYTLESVQDNKHKFNFVLKTIYDIGYKIIYQNGKDDIDDTELIGKIKIDDTIYNPLNIIALEKNTKPISRYTEASLIKELETKGIGRPSTFASIVSKIFERNYALKEDKHNYKDIELELFKIEPLKDIVIDKKKTQSASDKNKIFITDIGGLVFDFMNQNFDVINSYDFTSNIENELDSISNGTSEWIEVTKNVYESFHNTVVELSKNEDKKKTFKNNKLNLIGEHEGKNVYSYVGRFGPCIQYGEQNDNCRYVSINKKEYPNINEISLEQAVNLLRFPILIGVYENKEIYIKTGNGLYLQHDKTSVGIENESITLDEAIEKIKEKKSNIIKEFANIKVLRGPYGVYIRKGTKNIAIPKDVEDPEKLSKKDCDEIIANYKPKKRNFKKKK